MITNPTKLNDESIDKFCYAISLGMSQTGACRFAGFSPKSLHVWLKQYEEGNDNPEIKRLAESYERAKATFEENMVAGIRECANQSSNWRGFSYLLEKRQKSDWGEQSPQMMLNQLLTNFMIDLQNSEDLSKSEKDLIFQKIIKFRENYTQTEMTKPQQTQEN